MMACSPEKPTNEVITLDHAVLLPPVPGASLMSYVEAVATVIGSCHIHSVFEDTEFMKIYLNEKKFADFLVNSGVSVLGRRVNVDYAIPRADKVILKNVDPIIPDSLLMRFLCYYGSPVSTIIHEKIASNLEYSHIECGTRKVYMNLLDDKKPPGKVSVMYQELPYRFDMFVERFDKRVHEVDSSTTEETNEEENVDDTQEIESISSLKPNIEEIIMNEDASKRSRSSKKLPTPAQVAYRNRGKNTTAETSVTYAARKIKSRAAKGWYKNKIRKAKNVSSDRTEAKKLVGNVAKTRGGRRSRGGMARGRGRGNAKNSLSNDVPILNLDSSLVVEASPAITNMEVGASSPESSTPKNKKNVRSLTQFPLSTEELKKLLFQTRCHRAPLQVALEFLNRRNVPNATDELMKQLLEYHNMIKVQSLRIRIRRLVKSLESAIKDKAAA